MRLRVPGDKSLTQRALILAALADGESRLSGLLHGGDAASTAGALRRLGIEIPELGADAGEVRIVGRGLRGLSATDEPLDFGNSGTGARLMTGVIAGAGIEVTIDGDQSLRSRPMARIVEPLEAMGASFRFATERGRLPMRVSGAHPLRPIDWSSKVASAQVKSSILLAGLTGQAFALVTEPTRSRDHTERMLNALGAAVVSHAVEGQWRVELRDPPSRIDPLDFRIPGDPSSAAFLMAFAAAGGARGPLTIEGVGLNPTRTGFFEVLERMGAEVDVVPTDKGGIEDVGDVTVRPSQLSGTVVEGAEIPAVIDELPLIAVLGAVSQGVTEIRGAEELRTKESDRIDVVVRSLRSLGAEVEELPDGMIVSGSGRALRGAVSAHHDHRIAMSFGVLGSLPGHDVEVRGASVADVSFPGFRETLHKAGALR